MKEHRNEAIIFALLAILFGYLLYGNTADIVNLKFRGVEGEATVIAVYENFETDDYGRQHSWYEAEIDIKGLARDHDPPIIVGKYNEGDVIQIMYLRGDSDVVVAGSKIDSIWTIAGNYSAGWFGIFIFAFLTIVFTVAALKNVIKCLKSQTRS